MMERIAHSLNTSEDIGNRAASAELPALAVIFTPIFVVQMLVGLVSNLLLLILLIKATSVNNNINIFLCSMAANNLLSLFLSLTLVVSTATQRWVFGQTMCAINQVIMYVVSIPNILLPAFISRERYRAVLHFFEWKPYTKRIHFKVGAVWMFAAGAGVVGLMQGGQVVGETDGVIYCYAPSRWLNESIFTPLYIMYLALGCVFGIATLAFGMVHYVYIFRELRAIKRNCTHSSTLPLRCNRQDIPIQWKSELRALNSVACVFFMTAVPFTAGSLHATAVAAVSIAKGITFAEADIPILHLVNLCSYLMPTASPMVLIIVNRKFRRRIKDLLKWQLKPDDATISAVANSVATNL